MKITALVENTSESELSAQHGLSLYIETARHKILFDLGPGPILFENAKKKGIDLASVDLVILSHGHKDHGGALEEFLKLNHTAKVFVQRKAFEKHYAKLLFFKLNVGLDPKLASDNRIVQLDGDFQIDDELTLFTVKDRSRFHSNANDVLFTDHGKDDFSHEQNLIIHGGQNALILGCGHSGIVNIMETAKQFEPKICVGGYHLFNPLNKKTAPPEVLDGISEALLSHDTHFYTCHCTGPVAYEHLKKKMPNLSYLGCGETIDF